MGQDFCSTSQAGDNLSSPPATCCLARAQAHLGSFSLWDSHKIKKSLSFILMLDFLKPARLVVEIETDRFFSV